MKKFFRAYVMCTALTFAIIPFAHADFDQVDMCDKSVVK
jgi:hypothetical protein